MDGEYFTLEAEPGTTHELVVVIGNADPEKPLGLRTYANDIVPATNGGFALALEDVAPTDTATWIDYPAETLNFGPREGTERVFTVRIPEDAAPGQYIAGLAAETADPVAIEGTDLLNQVIRKSIAVFITVPGEQKPSFTLGQPEFVADGVTNRIIVPVANTGNVLVRPTGELTLADAKGETVLVVPVAMGSVYADITVPLSVSLVAQIPDGDYTLSGELTDEETGATALIENGAIAITNEQEAPAQFGITADITLAPDAANPAYVDAAVTITNQGAPVADAEVLLDVMRDGEMVETFALAPSLALPQGETVVAQRYIPPAGWEAGSWSFLIRLNVIDPTSGSSTNVVVLDTIPAIEVGE
jgi:hypothetical protein